MGGDEFAIIVASVHTASDVADVASKLRLALAEPFQLDAIVVRISASVGFAVYPDDGIGASALWSVADRRMYREKASRVSEQPLAMPLYELGE